jgi:hypothetical protein
MILTSVAEHNYRWMKSVRNKSKSKEQDKPSNTFLFNQWNAGGLTAAPPVAGNLTSSQFE